MVADPLTPGTCYVCCTSRGLLLPLTASQTLPDRCDPVKSVAVQPREGMWTQVHLVLGPKAFPATSASGPSAGQVKTLSDSQGICQAGVCTAVPTHILADASGARHTHSTPPLTTRTLAGCACCIGAARKETDTRCEVIQVACPQGATASPFLLVCWSDNENIAP